jgi:hypothetical protein
MSLRALPLILIVVILYNVVVFWGGVEALDKELFKLPLPSGVAFPMKISDLLMVVMLVTLFIELLKATWTSTASLLDHGLSMLVFVLCLVEFIVVTRCATSTFFFITIATLIDVIAGYTIGIRVARRDLSIGGNN